MTTAELRAIIRAAAEAAGAARHVWQNGLGFDWRGWEYTISERPESLGQWYAYKRHTLLHGTGETPQQARKNARPFAV